MAYTIEEFLPPGATKTLYVVTEDGEPTLYVHLRPKEAKRFRNILSYVKEPYVWPGGYPLVATCEDGEVMCPTCVGQHIDDCLFDARSGWYVASVDPYYEGPTLVCSNCDAEMKSAYGDPDEEPDNVVDWLRKAGATVSPGTEGALCDIEVPSGMPWSPHGPVFREMHDLFPGTIVEHCGHHKARVYKKEEE